MFHCGWQLCESLTRAPRKTTNLLWINLRFAPANFSKQRAIDCVARGQRVNWKICLCRSLQLKQINFSFLLNFWWFNFYDLSLCAFSRLIISFDSLEIICKTPIKSHTKFPFARQCNAVGGVVYQSKHSSQDDAKRFQSYHMLSSCCFLVDSSSRRKSSHEI